MQVISVNQIITLIAMGVELIETGFAQTSVIVRTVNISVINQVAAALASGAFVVGTAVTNRVIIHRRIVVIRDDFTAAGA